MASTTRGIVYPTSGDNIAPLETHFANIANSVEVAIDNALVAVGAATYSGAQSFTGPATTSATVNVTVTFPVAFESVPNIVCSVRGQSTTAAYIATITGSPTITGFVATVYKASGSTAESLNLEWMAK